MPSVTLNLYDIHRKKQASGVGGYDLVTTLDVYCMIVISSYTVNQNTHDFRDDLGANEVSGTSYTTLGNICDNPTATLDGSGNFSMDFDDPATWSYNAAGFTNGDKAIFYIKRGGASSADNLIAYSNTMGGVGNGNGDFTVSINASGLYTSAR